MDYVWTMYGPCMDYEWSMYGICVEYVWTMYGLCIDYVWTMYGLWRVDESYVDSLSLSIFTRHSRNGIKAILYSNIFIIGGHPTPLPQFHTFSRMHNDRTKITHLLRMYIYHISKYKRAG